MNLRETISKMFLKSGKHGKKDIFRSYKETRNYRGIEGSYGSFDKLKGIVKPNYQLVKDSVMRTPLTFLSAMGITVISMLTISSCWNSETTITSSKMEDRLWEKAPLTGDSKCQLNDRKNKVTTQFKDCKE